MICWIPWQWLSGLGLRIGCTHPKVLLSGKYPVLTCYTLSFSFSLHIWFFSWLSFLLVCDHLHRHLVRGASLLMPRLYLVCVCLYSFFSFDYCNPLLHCLSPSSPCQYDRCDRGSAVLEVSSCWHAAFIIVVCSFSVHYVVTHYCFPPLRLAPRCLLCSPGKFHTPASLKDRRSSVTFSPIYDRHWCFTTGSFSLRCYDLV
jgi:hypothetical protein